MRLLDADLIAAHLPPRRLVEAMRDAHRDGDMGAVEQLLLYQGDNAALTWAGWQAERGLAVKIATAFPGNAAQGQPNVQSVVVVFDPADGTPRAAIHGTAFTRMKTAADSALGADLLAVPHATTLAVLGAGGQAETHIRFMLAVRPTIRRIAVWARRPEAALTLAARLTCPGVAVAAVAEARDAVAEAAVVCCLTGATVPVLHGDWLAPGTHVDLVGGYTPTMRESDDGLVRRGRLFADSLRFGVATCGDYAQPIAAGIIPPTAVLGDLFGLCGGRVEGRLRDSDITVFKNGGGGHLDLMAACAFLTEAG